MTATKRNWEGHEDGNEEEHGMGGLLPTRRSITETSSVERTGKTASMLYYYWSKESEPSICLRKSGFYYTKETCNMVMSNIFTRAELTEVTVISTVKEAPSAYDIAKWAYMYLVELEVEHMCKIKCVACRGNGKEDHTCLFEKDMPKETLKKQIVGACRGISKCELENMVSLSLLTLDLPTTHAICASQCMASLLRVSDMMACLTENVDDYQETKTFLMCHIKKDWSHKL